MRVIRPRPDTGDTIIEVLICTAIISLLLTAAFNSSRDSLYQFQQAQERGEATKLVEQQLERVRAASLLSTSTTSGVFSAAASGNFCMAANLTVDTSTPCLMGPANRYGVTITRSGADQRTFQLAITWDRIGGGSEELRSAYRVYPTGN